MKASVALCTYNGERYIYSQLKSILNQSRPIDQIVICDDCSTDSTIDIIEQIKTENQSVDIQIFKNDFSLGVCGNFEKAISKCSGDIIFLSDQDDLWYENKVEFILKKFEGHKDKSVYFTNANFINSKGDVIHSPKDLFYAVGLDKLNLKMFDKGCAFELFFLANRATGATMAFRRSFVPHIAIQKKVISHGYFPLHDYSIAMAAITCNCLGYIEEKLMCYRLHDNQTCGLGALTSMPYRYNIVDYRCYRDANDVWKTILPNYYKNRINFIFKRNCFSHNRYTKTKQIISMISDYKRFYPRLWMKFVLFDLLTKNN